jgi:hypothetical protein
MKKSRHGPAEHDRAFVDGNAYFLKHRVTGLAERLTNAIRQTLVLSE